MHTGRAVRQKPRKENKELVGSVQNAVVVEVGSKGGFIAKTDSYIPVIVDGVNLGDFIKVKIICNDLSSYSFC